MKFSHLLRIQCVVITSSSRRPHADDENNTINSADLSNINFNNIHPGQIKFYSYYICKKNLISCLDNESLKEEKIGFDDKNIKNESERLVSSLLSRFHINSFLYWSKYVLVIESIKKSQQPFVK